MINNEKNNTLLVSGMHRTGHHAIMQWITSNLNLNTIFDKRIIKKQKSIFDNYENIITGQKNDIIVYDLENYQNKYKKFIKEFDVKVLIIRDPFNTLSSIKKLKQNNNKKFNIEKYLSIYEFNVTNVDDFDFFILYNNWFSDVDYRIKIGKILNLNESCKNKINNITKDGDGSSFDRFNYSNNIDNMKVFERYKYLSKNEIKLIRSNKNVIYFTKKYFNDILQKINKEYEF